MLDISAFYKIFLNKKRGLKPRIWLRGKDQLPIFKQKIVFCLAQCLSKKNENKLYKIISSDSTKYTTL